MNIAIMLQNIHICLLFPLEMNVLFASSKPESVTLQIGCFKKGFLSFSFCLSWCLFIFLTDVISFESLTSYNSTCLYCLPSIVSGSVAVLSSDLPHLGYIKAVLM